jgi:hypothetical protein
MIFMETNIIRRWKTNNMINATIVWTLIAAVQLALVGTILLSTLVTVQIAVSYTTYANNSVTFPISKAYVNGNMAYFIATDASDNQTAASIAENLGYDINYAPTLTLVPESAQQQGYEFVNGINGMGAFGFQIPIATALPGDKGYSPIVQLNLVNWNDNTTARELKSAEEILIAQNNGELEIARTDILINSPAIQHRQ